VHGYGLHLLAQTGSRVKRLAQGLVTAILKDSPPLSSPQRSQPAQEDAGVRVDCPYRPGRRRVQARA
jgi:hypothetical protein